MTNSLSATSLRNSADNGASQAALYARLFPKIAAVLRSRGLDASDAEGLAQDVLTECFYGRPGRSPLLEGFRGQCSVDSWTIRIAINRLIDRQRRGSLIQDHAVLNGTSDEIVPPDFRVPAPEMGRDELSELTVWALQKAFDRCAARDVVLLQLVHSHFVEQQRIARFLGWTDSKLSRHLSALRGTIKAEFFRLLRERDPHLELAWEDLITVPQFSSPEDGTAVGPR